MDLLPNYIGNLAINKDISQMDRGITTIMEEEDETTIDVEKIYMIKKCC